MRWSVLVQVLWRVVNLLGRYDRGGSERWIATLVQHRVWTSGMVIHGFFRGNVRVVCRCLVTLGSDVVVL